MSDDELEEIDLPQKPVETKKKRPGALKGALSFVNLIVIILAVRWIVFEIFLIPSGSMYPKLFVNDFIVVSKVDFGLRIPFTQTWAYGPKLPKRTAITVFKDPDDTKYLIKRLVGLPEDKLETIGDFIVSLNGEKVTHLKIEGKAKEDLALSMGRKVTSFDAYVEVFPGIKNEDSHTILTSPGELPPYEMADDEFSQSIESFEVPYGYLLFMGDHRNNSYDGRRFGYVEAERLVGRARFIALSCEENIIMGSGCNITTLRPDRLGNGIAY